jgi:steroid delta-isomerase-like uncharacterized protein
MCQDHVALVRRWFDEVWNQRRPQTIDELLTGESICHSDEGPIRGPHEFKERQYMPFTTMFPDLRIEVVAAIAQAEQVVVRWTATGTHQGDGLGIRATGEPVSFQGMTWVQIHDGKMIEGWQHSNIPEVLRSLATRASS